MTSLMHREVFLDLSAESFDICWWGTGNWGQDQNANQVAAIWCPGDEGSGERVACYSDCYCSYIKLVDIVNEQSYLLFLLLDITKKEFLFRKEMGACENPGVSQCNILL